VANGNYHLPITSLKLLRSEVKLIGELHCKEILDQALAASRAQQTEALVIALDMNLTRFANNTIHQNVSESNVTLTVRAVAGRRQGSASTNDLSPAGLQRAADTARALALATPEDPHFIGLSAREAPPAGPGFDETTAAFGPQARAQATGEVCRAAGAVGLNASGAFSTGTREYAVANSLGLRAYHAGTLADFVTVVLAEGGAAGHAQASGWRVGDLDVPAAGAQAVHKALRGQNPRRLAPGEYPVVFEPYATYDVIHMLATSGMSAEAVHEGRSWMRGRLGQPVMSPNVSLWDDGYDLRGVPLPFDVEGTPRRRLDVVRAGVVGEPAHDWRTAAREGKTSTGHAAPPEYRRWRTGPVPLNLFMAEGQTSLDEMIASTERGLYVSRFWYTRVVHPRDCVVTGMTRDGLFWIEDGRIAYPVVDLRFTQSYVRALAGAEAISRESRLLMDAYGFGIRAPAVKLAAWRFTGSKE
jgi:predicted Zn-dependent protease